MSIEQFKNISLVLGVGGLCAYMLFIIYDLGRQSQAGKFGYFVIFGALGLGLFGLVVKTVLVEVIGL